MNQTRDNKSLNQKFVALHERALAVAKTYIKAEGELVSIFQELDRTRAYLHFGANSLTAYGIEILKLSEGTAANLVTVARKSVEFPALKAAVESGAVSISKARKIAPVITKENQNAWLELAKSSSSRVIEKEVARLNPQFAIPEKLKYKTESRLEISFGVSEQLAEKLKRVKDLIAQQNAKLITSEEALERMADEYIERHDPVEIAKRAELRKIKEVKTGTRKTGDEKLEAKIAKPITPGNAELVPGRVDYQSFRRQPLPSTLKHAVTLRDLRQCTHVNLNGKRCDHTKWLDVHHIVPVGRGGTNDIKNLTTLCSAHHRMLHK